MKSLFTSINSIFKILTMPFNKNLAIIKVKANEIEKDWLKLVSENFITNPIVHFNNLELSRIIKMYDQQSYDFIVNNITQTHVWYDSTYENHYHDEYSKCYFEYIINLKSGTKITFKENIFAVYIDDLQLLENETVLKPLYHFHFNESTLKNDFLSKYGINLQYFTI
ncbi:MAG: hypothetical protein QM487_09925 [Candidatus Marithrix sp.]